MVDAVNRRGFLAGMMAGGVIVAGELWIPGQKLISIPSGKVFGNEYGIDSLFRMIDRNTVEYVGEEDKIVSMTEFYDWMRKYARDALRLHDSEPMMVSLSRGCRIINPEYLIEGTLEQDRTNGFAGNDQREYWSSVGGLGDSDLVVDKVYQPDYYSAPAERIRKDEDGLKGWR